MSFSSDGRLVRVGNVFVASSSSSFSSSFLYVMRGACLSGCCAATRRRRNQLARRVQCRHLLLRCRLHSWLLDADEDDDAAETCCRLVYTRLAATCARLGSHAANLQLRLKMARYRLVWRVVWFVCYAHRGASERVLQGKKER